MNVYAGVCLSKINSICASKLDKLHFDVIDVISFRSSNNLVYSKYHYDVRGARSLFETIGSIPA